jgi:hypothetical protein
VVMYYVLALNLFFGEAYEEVLRTAPTRSPTVAVVSPSVTAGVSA